MHRGFIFLIAAFVAAVPTLAQGSGNQPTADTHQRPRVGLVLGGGGARGFAHVGVLQVLEENRIPVDAIAGTSMGAVVGSLYASGEDSRRITEITAEIPWTDLFDDNIPRERMPFRRKRDQRDVLVDYRISFDKNGLVLPKGVLRGQSLYLTLSEYLAPARGIENFDGLAIPYRAVATDIESGTPVVLASGDIVTAVFASMAVPGGLPPVERDGKLLVDGGVTDNVPIDVARGLNAERLIVVDVGTPLRTRDRITSFVAVLDQMQLLLGRDNIERQLATLSPADVLIRPDLGDISTTGFDRSEDGIAAGRAAALAALDRLKPYMLSEAEWQAHLAARNARRPSSKPMIAFVNYDNRSQTPTSEIKEIVSAKAGEQLDARQMTEDLNNVYAIGTFRSARYGIDRSEGIDGEGITIVTEGDPTAENWIQLGLGLSTDFNRTSRVKLGLAYTDRDLFGSGAEWRSDIRLGSDLLIETGLYRQFGRLFAEVTPYWSRVDTVLYVNSSAIAQVREARLGARLDGGLLFGNWGELRIGVDWAETDLDFLVGAPIFGSGEVLQDASLRIMFTADALDNLNYPTKGVYGRVGWAAHSDWLGGDYRFNLFRGDVKKPLTWGRNTLLLALEGGYTANDDGQSLGDFRLGGFLRLSGLDPDQLIGNEMLLGRAIYYRRVSETAPIVNVPLYVGGSFELGNAWSRYEELELKGVVPAGSLFVSADTPLGPFTVAAGLARGNGSFYLILGRIF